MEDNGGTVTSSQVVINGQEYDPTEVQSLMDLGRKTQEYETKWNTKLDTVWPEYGKLKETTKTMEQELSQARSQLESFQQKKDAGTETSTDVKQAQDAARKLGIVLGDDLEQRNFVKKEDLPQLFQSWSQEQEGIRGIINSANDLEKQIDGSDGRPKFYARAVLAYASAYKIPDLMTAYEEMNSEAVQAWKSAQVASQKSHGLKTLDGGGAKKPLDKNKVNDDNLSAALQEALG